jgi:DNA adenine methylase
MILSDSMDGLPRQGGRIGVPPIKCQGIKTKLVPFIFQSIKWSETSDARWIEPFVGSGVVAFNLAPRRALLADTNPHVINFYQAIQRVDIDSSRVREFLTLEGEKLSKYGADYYYEVRSRFNAHGSPYDFLFLNRACFNGVIRFNRQGNFNVPFGHKPRRFSKAYITKIANQVNWTAKQMQGRELELRVADWSEILTEARPGDFVYMDPPYVGRHADYYSLWGQTEAERLASAARGLPCGYAVSMWLENSHRRNTHIDQHWPGMVIREYSHFYHVGSKEAFRNEMKEALIVKPDSVTPSHYEAISQDSVSTQQQLFEMHRRYAT